MESKNDIKVENRMMVSGERGWEKWGNAGQREQNLVTYGKSRDLMHSKILVDNTVLITGNFLS